MQNQRHNTHAQADSQRELSEVKQLLPWLFLYTINHYERITDKEGPASVPKYKQSFAQFMTRQEK